MWGQGLKPGDHAYGSGAVFDRDRWGWRARFGVLVIHYDPVPEPELWTMAPPGVAIYTGRFRSPREAFQSFGSDAARLMAESDELRRGAEALGSMHLQAISVCFMTTAFLFGLDWDRVFVEKLTEQAHGTPVTTSTMDLLRAIEALGVRRPLLVVPPWFSEQIINGAIGLLRGHGVEVVATHQIDLGRGFRDLPPAQRSNENDGPWVQRPEVTYEQVRQACPREADGVVSVGNGVRMVTVIEALEQDLKRPVVTANQAVLWHCLRRSGIEVPVSGFGSLFSFPLAERREQA
jgi:maleate cis-trans isomerase